MRKFKLLTICLLVFFTSCRDETILEKKGNLSILHLSGTPYTRGFEHGSILKKEIQIIINKWKLELEKNYELEFETILSHFFESTNFEQQMKKYCPDLLDEIYGISVGSKINYRTILAFQFSEEIDVLGNKNLPKHCTAIGIHKPDSNFTILSQNMDPPLYLHGFPTLLHIKNKEEESFVYTFPGFIGLNGLNSSGIGITCNSISMLNSSANGLPNSAIVRCVLNQKKLKDARFFIESVPIGIPQCYTIADQNLVICYECSANEKTITYAFDNKNLNLHTNFAISNKDFNKEFIALLAQYCMTIEDPYHCPRFFLAYDLIKNTDFNLDTHSIQEILSTNKPKLSPIANVDTYGSLIMKLNENPSLLIAPDRPDSVKYVEISF